MGLYIRSEEVARLARELADRMGETMTQAVADAIREKLERIPVPKDDWEHRWAEIRRIQAEVAAMPILDSRSPEEMLYDEDGLPK